MYDKFSFQEKIIAHAFGTRNISRILPLENNIGNIQLNADIEKNNIVLINNYSIK